VHIKKCVAFEDEWGDGIQKKMQNGLVVAAVIISIVVGACASFSTAISQDCEGLQDTFGLAKDATH